MHRESNKIISAMTPIDIIECTEGTHNCLQLCVNTVGSYLCTCRTGYRLTSDSRSCNGNKL